MDNTPLVITSRQNKTVKHLRTLGTNQKLRSETKTTILDGVHLCQSFMATGRAPLSCVVSVSGMAQAEVADILASLPESTEIVYVSDEAFDYISSVKNSVGIMFVIGYKSDSSVSNLSDDSVLLDRVQDPGNIGTILRSAAAAGVKQVLLSAGCAHAWSPQTLRAGMGAHFNLDIYEDVDLKNTIKNSTIPTYATSLQATTSIYGVDLSGPSAWLFGNEGQGASDDLVEACSETVIIPQSSNVESLNVAMSATVCLFEQVRQRQ